MNAFPLLPRKIDVGWLVISVVAELRDASACGTLKGNNRAMRQQARVPAKPRFDHRRLRRFVIPVSELFNFSAFG